MRQFLIPFLWEMLLDSHLFLTRPTLPIQFILQVFHFWGSFRAIACKKYSDSLFLNFRLLGKFSRWPQPMSVSKRRPVLIFANHENQLRIWISIISRSRSLVGIILGYKSCAHVRFQAKVQEGFRRERATLVTYIPWKEWFLRLNWIAHVTSQLISPRPWKTVNIRKTIFCCF